MRNTPVRGRTYDAVLTLAPGAATEAGTGGVSFSGATGPENNFLIDGVNTTDPAFGLLGTQLTLEFIGETEIITGGYNAEYGRATGGVVNVITKSGSNNFHGDVWFYATPFQLDPHARRPLGRSHRVAARKTKYGFDFGFDLGGPIVKDKIWFYVGFQPTFTTDAVRPLHPRALGDEPAGDADDGHATRATSTRTSAARRASTRRSATRRACSRRATSRTLDPAFTQALPDRHAPLQLDRQAQLPAQPEQQLGAAVHRLAADGERPGLRRLQRRRHDASSARSFENTHDALAALRLEARGSPPAARHRRRLPLRRHHATRRAAGGDAAGAFYQPVAVARRSSSRTSTPCAIADRRTARPSTRARCRTTASAASAFLEHTTVQRISAAASATYFARLGGTHALKLGFDFEDNIFSHKRNYTGGAYYRVNTDGSIEIYREYAQKSPDAEHQPERPRHSAAGHRLQLDGEDAQLRRLPARLVQRRLHPRPDGQRRRALGSAAGPGRRRLDADRHLRQLGAARRRDLRLHAQGPRQDLRELRLVLRVDPDGHQRPLVLG